MKHNMIDPLIVVYSRGAKVYKAIPFSSGETYVMAVASANRRSDVASEIGTVDDAIAYEEESGAWNITTIIFSDTTDYDSCHIDEAKLLLGWQ